MPPTVGMVVVVVVVAVVVIVVAAIVGGVGAVVPPPAPIVGGVGVGGEGGGPKAMIERCRWPMKLVGGLAASVWYPRSDEE